MVIGRPINIAVDDGSLESAGVAPRSSMATCMSLFSFLLYLMIVLMVCTCLSMNPLDFGNRGGWWGGEVVYWMLHLWTKSRNSFPAHCRPLSLTISSGRPKSDTVFLVSSVTTLLVVACRGETIRVL